MLLLLQHFLEAQHADITFILWGTITCGFYHVPHNHLGRDEWALHAPFNVMLTHEAHSLNTPVNTLGFLSSENGVISTPLIPRILERRNCELGNMS